MATSHEAYVDTSAFIALVDRSDSHHPLFRRLFSKPPRLVTTTLVVAEGHAWFLRRYDRSRAMQFMSLIEDLAPMKISSCGGTEQAAAVTMLRRFADQDLTLTDALGLHLMQARRITTCWSTDFHLGLGGAKLVIHEH